MIKSSHISKRHLSVNEYLISTYCQINFMSRHFCDVTGHFFDSSSHIEKNSLCDTFRLRFNWTVSDKFIMCSTLPSFLILTSGLIALRLKLHLVHIRKIMTWLMIVINDLWVPYNSFLTAKPKFGSFKKHFFG